MTALEKKTRLVEKGLRLWEAGKKKAALALVVRHKLYLTPFFEAHYVNGLGMIRFTCEVENPGYYGTFRLVGTSGEYQHDGIPEFKVSSLVRFVSYCMSHI